jgi:hypothetical protein
VSSGGKSKKRRKKKNKRRKKKKKEKSPVPIDDNDGRPGGRIAYALCALPLTSFKSTTKTTRALPLTSSKSTTKTTPPNVSVGVDKEGVTIDGGDATIDEVVATAGDVTVAEVVATAGTVVATYLMLGGMSADEDFADAHILTVRSR